jgi:imidazolonepropionase-like amidohydrolase
MVRRLSPTVTARRVVPGGRGVAAKAWLLGAAVVATSLAVEPVRAQATGSVVAFEGARLIPGDGRPAIETGVLVVDGDRIARVGAAGRVRVPTGATRVDVRGKTIVPAFLNAHTHVGFQRAATYTRENYTRAQILQDLDRALYFGVVAVISQGIDPGDVAFQVRADQAAGRLGGARLLLAGRGIGSPNAGPGAAAYQGIAYELTTAEDGRRAVDELAAQKVDVVKIWVDDRNGRAPRLPEAAYRAIIAQAHRRGLKANAHVFYLEDLKRLVDAGVDGLAHLARDFELDDAAVAAIVKRGVVVMPTLATPERTTHVSVPAPVAAWLATPDGAALGVDLGARVRSAFGGRTQDAADSARQRYQILERSVATLARRGAKLLLGSDTGIQDHPFGFTDHRELQMLVRAGVSPMQALVAATSRSAEYMGLPTLGTLAAGKTASFIVLDRNPLDDIANTLAITDVYVGGARLDRAALRERLR